MYNNSYSEHVKICNDPIHIDICIVFLMNPVCVLGEISKYQVKISRVSGSLYISISLDSGHSSYLRELCYAGTRYCQKMTFSIELKKNCNKKSD